MRGDEVDQLLRQRRENRLQRRHIVENINIAYDEKKESDGTVYVTATVTAVGDRLLKEPCTSRIKIRSSFVSDDTISETKFILRDAIVAAIEERGESVFKED